jgi:hypothetical protein
MRAVLLALFLGFAATAQAQDRTINLTAQVAVVEDPQGALGGAINPGDTITGSYTYNLATPDSNTLPTVGDYWHIGPGVYGISLQAGDLVFRSNPADVMFLVELVNDHGTPASDNYLLRSYHNLPASCGVLVEHISWQLDDPSLAALSDTRLSAKPPVLSAWQSIFGLMIEGPSFSWYIRAHVTSATLASRVDFIGPPARPSCQDLAHTFGLGSRQKVGTCLSEFPDTATKRP